MRQDTDLSSALTGEPQKGDRKSFAERALDAFSDAIAVFYLDGTIVHWSREAEKLYGFTAATALGSKITNLLSCYFDAGRAALESTLRVHGQWSGNVRRIAQDGSVRDVWMSCSLNKGEDGDKDVVVEHSRLASIRSSTGSPPALRQSNVRFSTLFHAMATGFFTLDTRELLATCDRLKSEGVDNVRAYIASHPGFLEEAFGFLTVIEVNPAAVRMMGVESESDLVGHPLSTFWSRVGIGTFIRSIDAAFFSRPSFEEKTIFQRVDGKRFEVHYSHIISPELHGERRVIIGLTDISEYVAAETALLEMKNSFAHHGRLATLGELSASISHEINQPLGAIMNFAAVGRRLLQRNEMDIAKLVQIQDNIINDAQRAADIIARTRSMASNQPSERARVNVNSLVEESLGFLGHELNSNSVALHLDLKADTTIEVDAIQVQQVLVNLVLNAIQAMDGVPLKARALFVNTRHVDEESVSISVEDRGQGITQESITRLFENFFTTKKTGLGMGLAICKQIVEAHGGAISASNEANGARFVVVLPQAKS